MLEAQECSQRGWRKRKEGSKERKEERKGRVPEQQPGPYQPLLSFTLGKFVPSLTSILERPLWPLLGGKKKKRHLLQLITVAESKGQKTMAWTRVGTVEVTRSGQILGI